MLGERILWEKGCAGGPGCAGGLRVMGDQCSNLG